MIRLNRAELLQKLESVQPGLSPREIVEQSSCFVFKDGKVITYNDEVACRQATDLKIDGAVQALPLLAILRKLPEEEVEVDIGNGHLLVSGKKKRAGIVMEKEVLLPIDSVEKPKKWHGLPEDFSEAVHIVQQCAGKDESQFWGTCLHIHPKWLEACDNHQLTRYKMKTGFAGSCLVRSSSIKHITALDMTEFSETESWVHFRNPAGLILSCRRYLEEYKDLSQLLKLDNGHPIILPKGLANAVEKAEIFSAENTDDNQVLVSLLPGKLKVKGQGVSGWYTEVKRLKYDGEPMSFMIAPNLLVELTKRQSDCEIAEDRLRVNGGKFVYVASLVKAKESGDGG